MSGLFSALTSRTRAWYPPKQPTTPPAAPSKAPGIASDPPADATQAPVNPPIRIRAMRPGGAVRLGVAGSLSTTSSTAAARVRISTEGTDPIKESGRSILSHPRRAAHAVAAGAVSERSPPNNPVRKADKSVTLVPDVSTIVSIRTTSHPDNNKANARQARPMRSLDARWRERAWWRGG
jgi:hypothetical protein